MIVVFGSINIDLVFVLAALPRSGETVTMIVAAVATATTGCCSANRRSASGSIAM